MKIVIAGAGGHGKVVCDAILSMGVAPSDVIGFVDDDPRLAGQTMLGFPVLPRLEGLGLDRSVRVALGIGDNTARRRQLERVLAIGHEPLTVIHARAVIAAACVVGRGVVAFASVVVNAETRLEDGVILNTGCTVDHDCRIGAYVHIALGAHLAGGVTVGDHALVGVGAVVVPGVSIGARSVVGAGGVVIEDIEADCVAVGVPARIVRRREADVHR